MECPTCKIEMECKQFVQTSHIYASTRWYLKEYYECPKCFYKDGHRNVAEKSLLYGEDWQYYPNDEEHRY